MSENMDPITCDDVRLNLVDELRGRLTPELRRAVNEHLERCAACQRARKVEAALDDVLARRLPRHPAPAALRARVAALAAGAAPPGLPRGDPPRDRGTAPARDRGGRARWARAVAPALAVVLAVATIALLVERAATPRPGALAVLAGEAVNDHLRVLRRERPIDVESAETHQVKPWFEGKLGFAPAIPAPVSPEMRLDGGAVGWFLDREAAVVVYRLRRHVVTLLVFRADGLAWPREAGSRDRVVTGAAARGFHVLLWRAGGLGYALVSDADPGELSRIASEMAART